MTNASRVIANGRFLDALSEELADIGYGAIDKDQVVRDGTMRLKRAHGLGVTGMIDVGAGDCYVWLDVNGITYSVGRYDAPTLTGDAESDAIRINNAVATITLPLTYRSDLDPIPD